jgi:hypothetical protein
MKGSNMINFPSDLETIAMINDWSRDAETGLLRAEYPNGAGYMLIRDNAVEYYEVCSDGSFKLIK